MYLQYPGINNFQSIVRYTGLKDDKKKAGNHSRLSLITLLLKQL